MASNIAKKAGNTSEVGANRAYSNRGSRKDKCANGMPLAKGRVGLTQPICHRSR